MLVQLLLLLRVFFRGSEFVADAGITAADPSLLMLLKCPDLPPHTLLPRILQLAAHSRVDRVCPHTPALPAARGRPHGAQPSHGLEGGAVLVSAAILGGGLA